MVLGQTKVLWQVRGQFGSLAALAGRIEWFALFALHLLTDADVLGQRLWHEVARTDWTLLQLEILRGLGNDGERVDDRLLDVLLAVVRVVLLLVGVVLLFVQIVV